MNPTTEDYYAALGVPEDASARDIKKAYRTLAREHHPDKNADDASAETRFKEVQGAYDVLGDQAKRHEYDQLRENPYKAGGFDGFRGGARGGGTRYYRTPEGTHVRVETSGAGPDEGFVFNDGGFGGVGDVFSQFFGAGSGASSGEPSGNGSTRRDRRAQDTEAVLRLGFVDALTGGPREVTLPGGATVRLDVPKGIRPGARLRLRGRGAAGGDLTVVVEVGPHPRFRREGDDLHTTERVNAAQAMLGTSRTIETVSGTTVRLTIPPGTQPGGLLRLRGQGVETEKAVGDLLVHVEVEVPRDLDGEARAALHDWADTQGLL